MKKSLSEDRLLLALVSGVPHPANICNRFKDERHFKGYKGENSNMRI
jgi:hypothetical protein